jgi:hypothetical protein
MEVKFDNPEFRNLGANIYRAAEKVESGVFKMVEKERHKDSPGVVIASTGPSIEDHDVLTEIHDLVVNRGYDLIALKESIKFLRDGHNLPVKYSVSMDPGRDRQITRTPVYDDVVYFVASSCSSELFDHISKGATVEVFHSACGYSESAIEPGMMFDVSPDQFCIVLGEYELKTTDDYTFSPVVTQGTNEVDIYQRLFPTGDTMQGGFTVTNRALALATYLGYPDIVIAGADFGWREDHASDTHYASFVTVGAQQKSYMTDEGRIDGNPWLTRPDQIASAADIAKRAQEGTIRLLGDTMAAALTKRSRDFIDQLVQIT